MYSSTLQRIYGKWRNTESPNCKNRNGKYDNGSDFTQWKKTGVFAAPWVWQRTGTKENRIVSRVNEGLDYKMHFASFQCAIVQCSSKAGPKHLL